MQPLDVNAKRGNIIILYGPMNSQKTAQAIAWAKDISVHSGGKNVVAFRIYKDERSDMHRIIANPTGRKTSFPAETIVHPQDAVDYIDSIQEENNKWIDAIFFDELNFYDDPSIISVMQRLKSEKKRRVVVGTGLNKNFRGEPFGFMESIIAIADEAIFHQAYCKKLIFEDNTPTQCSKPAVYTQRLVADPKAEEFYAFYNKKGKIITRGFVPAHYRDPVFSPEVVDGKGKPGLRREIYISVCPEHFLIPGKPETQKVETFVQLSQPTLEQVLHQFPQPETSDIIDFLKNENRILEQGEQFMPRPYRRDPVTGVFVPL